MGIHLQGFNHFSGFLHNFVLTKLATSSTRVMVQHLPQIVILHKNLWCEVIMGIIEKNHPVPGCLCLSILENRSIIGM